MKLDATGIRLASACHTKRAECEYGFPGGGHMREEQRSAADEPKTAAMEEELRRLGFYKDGEFQPYQYNVNAETIRFVTYRTGNLPGDYQLMISPRTFELWQIEATAPERKIPIQRGALSSLADALHALAEQRGHDSR
jgi:hypothetical protein